MSPILPQSPAKQEALTNNQEPTTKKATKRLFSKLSNFPTSLSPPASSSSDNQAPTTKKVAKKLFSELPHSPAFSSGNLNAAPIPSSLTGRTLAVYPSMSQLPSTNAFLLTSSSPSLQEPSALQSRTFKPFFPEDSDPRSSPDNSSPKSPPLSSSQAESERIRKGPPPVKRLPLALQRGELPSKMRKDAESQLRECYANTERYSLLGEGKNGIAFLVQEESEIFVLKFHKPCEEGIESALTNLALANRVTATLLEYYALTRIAKVSFVAVFYDFEFHLSKDKTLITLLENVLNQKSSKAEEPRHKDSLFSFSSSLSPEKILEDYVSKNFSGYHKVQYVSRPFPKNPDLVVCQQLKAVFEVSYKYGIPVDAQSSNFGITDSGKLLYFDPHPTFRGLEQGLQTEEERARDNYFHCLIEGKLNTFTSKNSPMWKFLDPRPKGTTSSSSSSSSSSQP